MKLRLTWVAVFLVMVGLSGCMGGTGGIARDPRRLGEQQLQAMEEMTTILESIQDDATAAAALPRLETAADRLRAINTEINRLQDKNRNQDTAKAFEQLNDPAVQEQIRKVTEAGGRMVGANLHAQLKAPGKREQIRAACDRANVSPKGSK